MVTYPDPFVQNIGVRVMEWVYYFQNISILSPVSLVELFSFHEKQFKYVENHEIKQK